MSRLCPSPFIREPDPWTLCRRDGVLSGPQTWDRLGPSRFKSFGYTEVPHPLRSSITRRRTPEPWTIPWCHRNVPKYEVFFFFFPLLIERDVGLLRFRSPLCLGTQYVRITKPTVSTPQVRGFRGMTRNRDDALKGISSRVGTGPESDSGAKTTGVPDNSQPTPVENGLRVRKMGVSWTRCSVRPDIQDSRLSLRWGPLEPRPPSCPSPTHFRFTRSTVPL